jgi:WD40 repeat protein
LRLWETGTWQIKTEVAVAENHELTQALLSRDGKFAVTWGPPTRIWNLATHESVALGSSTPGVNSVATFSPDGKVITMVEGEQGKSVARAWDSATGRLMYQSDADVALTTYEVPISPDGKYIAVICGDDNVRLVKTGSWETAATLGGPTQRPRLAAFSPDGKYLATSGYDRVVHIWQTGTWQTIAELRGHTGRPEKMRFSNDGRVLVTSSEDGTARVWESGAWRGLAILQGHTMPMHDLAVSPDGHYVVTTAKDSRARVWEVDSSGSSDVVEVDGATENGLADDLPTVYSPDGSFIAVRNSAGVVEVWETGTPRKIIELGRGDFLAFSSDGRYAFKTAFGPFGRRNQYDAEMWDVRTWKKVADLTGHSEPIRDIAFSSDGQLVATAGGEVHVWQAGTGKSLTVLKDPAWRVVFSSDGKWLATVGQEHTPRVWETATWRDVAELRGHTAWVRAIAFNRDGSRLVTAGEDNTARIWETGTWRPLSLLEGHTDRVDEVAFSPDGKYVLTASWDKTARLWETETGKVAAVLEGHTEFINSARFSPDGRLIATAGDRTVRVWNTATGRLVVVLPVFALGLDSSGSQRSVRAASFSPNGRSLLVSGSDATTRIYSWEMFAPLEDLLALGRTRVTRELTTDEKKKYLHEVVAEKQQSNQ